MKYFNDDMYTEDARRAMFKYASETRDDDKKYNDIMNEYNQIMPILYEKEASDPNRRNVLTS
jgi:hypothetical protein